jgi:hypothetical protein
MITGEWPAAGVTFDVRRGSFVIPDDLFEDGREDDLRRLFAQRIPNDAHAARRERVPGGVRIYWRSIEVVPRRRLTRY